MTEQTPLYTPLDNSQVHRVLEPQSYLDAHNWLDCHRGVPIAVDVETTGIGWHDTLTSIQFGNKTDAFVLDPADPNSAEIVEKLVWDHQLVAHNAAFDSLKLAQWCDIYHLDYNCRGEIDQQTILHNMTDTQILSRLIDPR